MQGPDEGEEERPLFHRRAIIWTLLAGASFLAGNAWLITRHLGVAS